MCTSIAAGFEAHEVERVRTRRHSDHELLKFASQTPRHLGAVKQENPVLKVRVPRQRFRIPLRSAGNKPAETPADLSSLSVRAKLVIG
jgi:hypothetical protein